MFLQDGRLGLAEPLEQTELGERVELVGREGDASSPLRRARQLAIQVDDGLGRAPGRVHRPSSELEVSSVGISAERRPDGPSRSARVA